MSEKYNEHTELLHELQDVIYLRNGKQREMVAQFSMSYKHWTYVKCD